MTEPNIPMLRKTMEFIEANPNGWDQDTWAAKGLLNGAPCGSTMCFAGTTVFLAGATPQFTELEDHPGYFQAEFCETPEGTVRSIEHYAAQLLGLTPDQADEIFYSTALNDPCEMRELVEAVIGEKL